MISTQNKLNGINKSLDEQIKVLEQILNKNKNLKELLDILENYSKEEPSFKNYYITAGCINQTVFNYYHDYKIDYGIKDYDIVYYDEDISYEKEDIIIKEIEKKNNLNIELDIKNEKRVPIWYEEKYKIKRKEYTSVEDSINRWTTTVTCIGIRKENNKLIVYAPYGLNDLFSMTIRPVKIDTTKESYQEKVNKWKNKWDKLDVIEW